MSGRVTRRKRKAANSDPTDWILFGNRPVGWCPDLRHEKFVTNMIASVQLYGPFDGVKVADCGCRFEMIPVCSCCGVPMVAL